MKKHQKTNANKDPEKSGATSGPKGDENIFLVPDNFFNRLETDIMKKVRYNSSKTKLLRMHPVVAGIAAAILIMLAFTATFIALRNVYTKPDDSPGTSDIIAYLTEETDDISDNLTEIVLVEMNESYEINMIPEFPHPNDSISPSHSARIFDSDTSLSDEDIMEYLSEEGINPEDL
jgi:hypothetical protein